MGRGVAMLSKGVGRGKGKGKDKGKDDQKAGHWRHKGKDKDGDDADQEAGDQEAGHWRHKLTNTFVRPTPNNSKTQHMRRRATCFGLPELFLQLGPQFTAKELYEYWATRNILVHKRSHGSAKQARQVAAHERFKGTGRWGFGNGRW